MHSKFDLDSTKTYFVLDFDRTIGNTDKFNELLEYVISEETNIKIEFLRHARFKAEAEGQSFDAIAYLHQYLKEIDSSLTWIDIQQKYISTIQKEDMLEPNAGELLKILDKKQLQYGFITYGNEAWQLAKIEGANLLSVPHLVTHIQEKGIILTGWKQDTGEFLLPPALSKTFESFVASTIVFLDDKAASFNNIPEGVIGIRVRPSEGIKLQAQMGTIPEEVVEVEGIKGATAYLFPDEEQVSGVSIDKT